MSRFNSRSDVFIPRCWQVAPLLSHAYIARDRIYDIYTAEPRNWNRYYEPSYTRLREIRNMSGRIVQVRVPKPRPYVAPVHQLRSANKN